MQPFLRCFDGRSDRRAPAAENNSSQMATPQHAQGSTLRVEWSKGEPPGTYVDDDSCSAVANRLKASPETKKRMQDAADGASSRCRAKELRQLHLECLRLCGTCCSGKPVYTQGDQCAGRKATGSPAESCRKLSPRAESQEPLAKGRKPQP